MKKYDSMSRVIDATSSDYLILSYSKHGRPALLTKRANTVTVKAFDLAKNSVGPSRMSNRFTERPNTLVTHWGVVMGGGKLKRHVFRVFGLKTFKIHSLKSRNVSCY